MDHLIPAEKRERERERERTCHLVDFAIAADPREKTKESEKIDKNLNLVRELESDSDTNYNWCAWNRGLE